MLKRYSKQKIEAPPVESKMNGEFFEFYDPRENLDELNFSLGALLAAICEWAFRNGTNAEKLRNSLCNYGKESVWLRYYYVENLLHTRMISN